MAISNATQVQEDPSPTAQSRNIAKWRSNSAGEPATSTSMTWAKSPGVAWAVTSNGRKRVRARSAVAAFFMMLS